MAQQSSFERSYWYSAEFFDGDAHRLVYTYPHANYRYGMHAHQFYEINIITAGEGEHRVEDAALPVRAGDVFVLPPEIRHCYVGRERIDVYHVLLSPGFLQKYRDELSALPGFSALFDIEPFLREAAGKRYNLHLSAAQLQEVQGQLQEIALAQQQGLYVHQTLLTLPFVSRLCLWFKERLEAHPSTGTRAAELLAILEHVQANLEEKLTLEQLAAFANMSRATLSRLFRAELHCSPMAYVMRCRVEKAQRLLAQGKYSKSEIAQLCGFYDSAHMNRNLRFARG